MLRPILAVTQKPTLTPVPPTPTPSFRSGLQKTASDQGSRSSQPLAKRYGEDALSEGKLIKDKRIPLTPTLSLSVLRNVPSYRQKHALSCEAASLWMVFRYFGLDVTEDQLIQEIGFDPTPLQKLKDGRVIWGDPNKGYVGNIDGWQLFASALDKYSLDERPLEMWGYGVYQEPLIKVAERYGLQALEISRIDQIYEYLERGWLIIVYVPCRGRTQAVVWEWYTPEGKAIKVINCEHAIVVKGYDESYTYVEDPIREVAQYSRPDFETAWNHLRRGIALRLKVSKGDEEAWKPPLNPVEF